MRFRSTTAAVLAAVLVLGAPAVATAAPADDEPEAIAHGACAPGWYYRTTSRGADTHSRIGPTHSNYNGTSSKATMTVTSTKSGTVSSSISGGTKVALSVKLATIESNYGVNVSSSVNVTLGNSFSFPVPAHKTGNADYGAWRAYVKGVEEYFNASCKVTKSQKTTTYSPYKTGWRTWIS